MTLTGARVRSYFLTRNYGSKFTDTAGQSEKLERWRLANRSWKWSDSFGLYRLREGSLYRTFQLSSIEFGHLVFILSG